MRPGSTNHNDVNNREPYNMQQSYYDHIPVHTSPGRGGPVKAIHDLPVMFPDSDSGFGSGVRGRSRHLPSDDFPSTPTRLRRSNSMSRLNGCVSDLSSRSPSPSHFGFEGSHRGLQDSLQDSEHRRSLLMHKLKEAQDTLQLQNERLNKIETAAKDNDFIVEDLKCKEREYRRKISNLQQYEDENERLRTENLRLRQEMQERIDTLDFQLKSLQSQHVHTSSENDKRTSLLDQTTAALSLLEQENCKLQMHRDTILQEVDILKETLQVTKSKHAPTVEENKILKTDANRLTQENTILSKKIHEMAGQMVELRNLLHAVKDENDRVTSNWKNIAEDKSRSSKQVENYQSVISELRTKLHSTTVDKDRLFQEKLETNHKLQQLTLDKEELLQHKQLLEEQVTDQQTQLSRTKSAGTQKYEELRNMEEELSAVKKVCEELSTELSSVKSYYERAVEQINMLENTRNMLQQQLDLTEQEKHRQDTELDRLAQNLEGKSREDRRELDILEDNYLRLKSDYKQLKVDKLHLEDKNHELEAKLRKANEDVKDATQLQQGDMETWKNACDRLTTSLSRKEDDLQKAADKTHELENMIGRLREELRTSNTRCEELTEREEDLDRLKSENRRLLQEKAENEQMMQLLETQKDVLTKSSKGNFVKMHDADHLAGKVDQLRNENESLRERILDLEKVRDNIIKQKEDLLANSELIYKQPGFDLLEDKVELLTSANGKLSETNSTLSKKLDAVNKENNRLKQVIEDGHGEPAMKEELERTRRQHGSLQDEFDQLLQDFNKLEEDNQRLHRELNQIKNSQNGGKEDIQKIKKERDGFQKQVQLLSGQLKLAEGSKKRTTEEMNKLKRETDEIKKNKSQSGLSPKKEIEKYQKQIQQLQSELNMAKENQHKQELTISRLKEKSLQDAGEELSQMKEELHSLMEEIDSKDQTIVFLEKELNETKEDYQQKESENELLQRKLNDISHNKPEIHSAIPRLVLNGSNYDRSPSRSLDSENLSGSLKNELEDTLKNRMDGETTLKSRPAESLFTKKTLSKLRSAPSPWMGSKSTETPPTEPDKGDNSGEGNERMQSLISKYRSYNEPGQLSLKSIRPYVFNPSRPASQSSSSVFSSAKTAEVKDTTCEKAVKRPPIPPPVSPKPILKKPILKPTVTNETEKTSSLKTNMATDTQEQKDINTLIQNCHQSHVNYLLELGQGPNLDTSKSMTCEDQDVGDVML
ncbi:hypothetical protein SNE40_012236 [Patella caerulea]|uniref:Uncharacterized protein n=1 Tax=Patella caerulea TaxID=87958 RepID=A0AAN8PLN1_PATCE